MINTDTKRLLKEKGVTQAKIARILKVTPVSVNNVISGKRKNPRIREAIALALGKPVSEICWPESAKEGNKQKSPSPLDAVRAF